MESKLESTVNYIPPVDCTLEAAKQNNALQDRLLRKQDEAYLDLPINKLLGYKFYFRSDLTTESQE